MTDDAPDEPGPPDLEAFDLEALARDWITLCQSELTALAADREMQEAWQTTMAMWAGAATAMLRGWPRATGFPGERGPSRPWPAAPAGPPAPAAAPDAGSVAVERLLDRIAELEARLAAVERGPGDPERVRKDGPGGGGGKNRPRTRRG
jgi:hypothetical protein